MVNTLKESGNQGVVQGHLQLVAWSVSGQPSKVEAFQRTQLQSFVLPGGPTLKLPTLVPGTNGQDGVNKFISSMDGDFPVDPVGDP